ncbi:MAG: hypothetical protein H8D97_01110 [Proteobacteria bacterium]|nr:hypothetical protein [Pseudomonadota bacterium]
MEKILIVELLFDTKIDSGFKTIIENKMQKSFDLKGMTNAIQGLEVDTEFKLEDKKAEEKFIGYIRYLLGKSSDGITNILIKFFDEELKMEIYFS